MPPRRMGMAHLNGHLFCAVDVETTGTIPGYHDIIQVCVLPLDYKIEPWKEFIPFYTNMQCKRPENIDEKVLAKNRDRICQAQISGLDPWRAADLFDEWFQS